MKQTQNEPCLAHEHLKNAKNDQFLKAYLEIELSGFTGN